MQLMSIVPKIYNRTRPPHQSNTEHDISTPNIFNRYKIVIDRHKQIFPDLDAVARCLDGTFVISDLLRNFKTPDNNRESFLEELNALHLSLKQSGYSKDYYLDKIETFIEKNTVIEDKNESLEKIFEDGMNCSLLQPDGKGWQKGKLKICFEFIPEENEPIATQEKPIQTHSSPLDEIRQLSN